MANRSKIEVGILADDLTSAADGAGPFVDRGLTTTVTKTVPIDTSSDVVAIDMATRSMNTSEAFATVQAATIEVDSADFIYKTVDSTLRGHVRAEIEAAMMATRRKRLVFAPAFPDAGRTTRGGVQFVDGKPVDQSTYADDPVHPVRSARLLDHLPETIGNAILLDAETQDDLNAQVAAIDEPHDVLWVGSPGMAKALALCVGSQVALATLPPIDRQPLIVVGSANQVSQVQANIVQNDGWTVLRAPTAREDDPTMVLGKLADEAVSLIEAGKYGAVIATGGDTMEAILDKLGISNFTLLGEMEPGFPVGKSELNGKPFLLAMKAGGFGDPETLLNAARQITARQEHVA